VADDWETELAGHPQVRDYVVQRAPEPGSPRIVYVESDDASPAGLREYLGARVADPPAVVVLRALPRTGTGAVDVTALPLPPLPAPPVGKAVAAGGGGRGAAAVVLVILGALAAWLLTDRLWPYSTDLSAVPSPWSGLFRGLYLAENLAFGLGVAFLFLGRRPMLARGGTAWAGPAHLAIVWLLAAWWPQDNLYRLAAKHDWPRQALLVYGFNVTLMVAAAIVAAFALTSRRRD
jgi:hypothetical protein